MKVWDTECRPMIATNYCFNMFNKEDKCLERCGVSVSID